MKKKLLVTGSNGLMGSDILPLLADRFTVIAVTEEMWDITDVENGRALFREHRPDAVLNLAALTNVDACEQMAEAAFRVNGTAPGILAGLCAEIDAQMVQMSTDYVFDGEKESPYTEEDRPNPVSVYGKSKLLGEMAVLAHPRSCVIRTEWIYGKRGDHFIAKVVRAGREKGTVRVVNDQRGAPTYAKDLARPIESLISGRMAGIYHVTNSGACTWFELARRAFSLLGIKVECVAISSSELARSARRPANSVLDCSKLRRDTGLSVRPWDEALAEFLTETRLA